MATQRNAQEEKRKALVEKLWHRTKPDAGTTEAEKQEARNKIEEILKNLLPHLYFDWKTGKFGPKPSDSAGRKQSRKAEATETASKPKDGWTTRDLAEYLSKLFGKNMTPKELRRILRTMDTYNDGVMTHYRWSGQNDPAVTEIVNFIKGKKGKTA